MRQSLAFALPLLIGLAAPMGLRAQEKEDAACCEACCQAPPEAVKGITARELGGHMRFLAHDLMRGRDTASAEIRLASEYIASRLFAAGADPEGDAERGGKGYFQRFPLEYVTPHAEGTTMDLIVERGGAKRVIPWKLGTDFVTFPIGAGPGEVEAPVVFAGYGRVDERAGVDDFDNLDVKDKFVLVLDGAPGGTPGGARRGGRFGAFGKMNLVRQRGALGLISVGKPSDGPSPADGAENLARMFDRPRMNLGGSPSGVPMLSLADPARDALAQAAGLDLAAEEIKPHALDGVRVRFKLAADREVKYDRNVIGLFPGSDPEKKKEVIIFSAHYDHVGVDDKGDIYNGSDDNSSGTSALLEIAEAFGDADRPARSVAFLWVSGEEKGLLGSAYFSDHVSLPEGYKIVADINLDMVSRNDGKQVGITPSDKHPDYSTLIPAAQAHLKAEGMEGQFNSDEFYARTDSYNFARKGIPIIFFFSGVHDDYHKPTDDVEKADFEKAARIARAAFRLGWEMAQASEAPKKIKPGEVAKSTDDGDAGKQGETPASGEEKKSEGSR